MQDLIHNPNETFYKEYLPASEPIQNPGFLNSSELSFFLSFFKKKFPNHGFGLANKLFFILCPFDFPELKEILAPKLSSIFGEFYIYSDINLDPVPQSSDFFIYQTKIFMPHTDSITHIPGYLHYKDVILPLAVDKDKHTSTYVCDQRYYGRASHLMHGKKCNKTTKYSNIFRKHTYDYYGVEGVQKNHKNQVSTDWLNTNIGNVIPHSFFRGLSIKRMFKWIPGSIIIQDPSLIHGPTNYKLHGANWKLGISIRIFKKNIKWQPNTIFSRYKPSCNLLKTKILPSLDK